jgi:hypothetical protein
MVGLTGQKAFTPVCPAKIAVCVTSCSRCDAALLALSERTTSAATTASTTTRITTASSGFAGADTVNLPRRTRNWDDGEERMIQQVYTARCRERCMLRG